MKPGTYKWDIAIHYFASGITSEKSFNYRLQGPDADDIIERVCKLHSWTLDTHKFESRAKRKTIDLVVTEIDKIS